MKRASLDMSFLLAFFNPFTLGGAMNWMWMLAAILAVIAVVYIGFRRWGKMMRQDKALGYSVTKEGPEDLIDEED